MDGMFARGGLRSGAARLLDERQKLIEDSLFRPQAKKVKVHYHRAPDPLQISMIPAPGKSTAMSRERSRTSDKKKAKLTFDNGMEVIVAEKKLKGFPAMSLSALMEFCQMVEYVAEFQPAATKLD